MQITFNGTAETIIAEMQKFLGGSKKETVKPDPSDVNFACQALVRAGEKIHAIRLYRACFPVGLLEAKKVIEALPPLPRF